MPPCLSPRLAWQLPPPMRKELLLSQNNFIVKPDGFTIPYNTEKIHGISTQRALKEGHELNKVLEEFEKDLHRCQKFLVGAQYWVRYQYS